MVAVSEVSSRRAAAAVFDRRSTSVTAPRAATFQQSLERLMHGVCASPFVDGLTRERAQEIQQGFVPGSNGKVRLAPHQIAVTPYLVVVRPSSEDVNGPQGVPQLEIYVHRHAKSTLLIPLGGGHVDPEQDPCVRSTLQREMGEEIVDCPGWQLVSVGRNTIFHIGTFGGSKRHSRVDPRTLRVDLRFACKVKANSLGHVPLRLGLKEKPGNFADLLPLYKLEEHAALESSRAIDSELPQRWKSLRRHFWHHYNLGLAEAEGAFSKRWMGFRGAS